MVERVLLVDDEPMVLDGLRRTLGSRYAITTAESGEEGLAAQQEALAEGEPFPVVVSDMRMPNMDGAQFLTRARKADPDMVAMILSGQADLDSTIQVVNDAGLFGFLTKPCPTETLTNAIDRALAQHALVMAERELLEQTVRGAVDILNDVMAASARLAYARTVRMRALITAVAPVLGLERDWELVLAARLSQVGCVAVPDPVLTRAYAGEELTDEEMTLYHGHPAAGAEMVGRISRLEGVAEWISRLPLSVTDAPSPDLTLPQLVFHAAAAFVTAYEIDPNPTAAVEALAETGFYPNDVIQAINKSRGVVMTQDGVSRNIRVSELSEGMELRADVITKGGMMLVGKGAPITASLADRIHRFADTVGVTEPLHVMDFRP